MLIQIVIGILFFIGVYILISDEQKWLRLTTFGYFILLTIIFAAGYMNQLNSLQDPELGDLSALRDWVYLFGYLYSVPLMVVSAYIWIPYPKKYKTLRSRVLMISFIIFIIMTAGHFLNLFFRLLFLGIA
ncbi:hypothetical protein J18TS1_42500 [Oceanobacillus oncorhynchi subsp. incaldanensis]|uniref:Uncharacterized protein n=2 Tax=Oceanobacillus TaxID=182709 RepID=A0A0A1MPG2_9BACI|nr:hypothetical protein [Oceanobacillus oncorhynchi]MDM8098473.1 hypothetical protein [Oceanobacillus oncorhynchi]UUI38935.1 hypothetical protein NP440_16580 [Oceanobacillus oncorhynchi]GIO21150.1 hypothetical protein J18TS1_42500 [Oceanobacillus oncorhynchi subsp. incaldanensis]CEI81527.1 hypothetical protein BN997_01352 [Oceanobacillus oncorhynchi]